MRHLKFLLTLTAMAPFSLFADPIEVGAPAPAISVTAHSGETIDLAQLYAKGPVVIYFYPKADTPGCTAQACNIRDNFSDLQAAGVTVLGVSADSVEDQDAFHEKYSLPFPLVADKDKRLGEAFGMGTILGIGYKRQTFLVVDGKIAWRDLKAKPATQAADVMQALKDISGKE